MSIRRSRLTLIAIGAFVALVYWFYLPSRGGKSDTAPSAAPIVAPGQSQIEGPYFSDQDRIADRIIAAINHTQNSMDIAVYSLTEWAIGSAIETAHQRGVQVRIVADEGQERDRHSEIPFLRAHGVPVRLSGGFKGQRSLMHNKFAVFDGKLVETGSFNWTTSAAYYNFENAIFIVNTEVSARYEAEFQRLWAQAH